ncbi:MAG: hypothetical protein K2I10_10650 [Lachnospiraceae bacterium]|nr:hypothetical protein [Lachnospiraceae bacterium]
MDDTKAQWHPAFCAAMELGFKDNRDILEFIREQNVSQKPLSLDLLVIKKIADFELTNSIGKIFRRYNIIEYKSPDASMNIDTFYKTIAYGCLYKTLSGTVNHIHADEITLTLIRERYPREMIHTLHCEGYLVSECDSGIYSVTGKTPFVTQIIVTNRLKASDKQNRWLKSLKRNLTQTELTTLIADAGAINNDSEQALADSVMSVVMHVNEKQTQQWKETMTMIASVTKLFEPELKIIAAGMAQDMAQDMAKDMAQHIAQDIAKDIAQHMAQDIAQDMAQAETEQSIIRLLQNKVDDRIILNSFPKYTQQQINKLKEAL